MKEFQQHRLNQKYKDYIQPKNQDIFDVIDRRLSRHVPNWYESKILDFGCNVGHLYSTSSGKILADNYVGVDVNLSSIEIAKKTFPDTNWIHYNRYNNTFNPTGTTDVDFEIPFKPKIITVIGVFTHMSFSEIKFWLDYLQSILDDNGFIIFSLWEDTHYYSYLGFLDRAFGINTKLVKPDFEKSIYLINRQELILDSETLPQKHFDWVETFYKRNYILEEFPNAKVLPDTTWAAHEVYIMRK
jgi:2-polyprenyl-3-methyl-5-hydroxy-6-metoxy-1,4-benzoquinol methylase